MDCSKFIGMNYLMAREETNGEILHIRRINGLICDLGNMHSLVKGCTYVECHSDTLAANILKALDGIVITPEEERIVENDKAIQVAIHLKILEEYLDSFGFGGISRKFTSDELLLIDKFVCVELKKRECLNKEWLDKEWLNKEWLNKEIDDLIIIQCFCY